MASSLMWKLPVYRKFYQKMEDGMILFEKKLGSIEIWFFRKKFIPSREAR
jgi:hypothetical protein